MYGCTIRLLLEVADCQVFVVKGPHFGKPTVPSGRTVGSAWLRPNSLCMNFRRIGGGIAGARTIRLPSNFVQDLEQP